MPKIECKEFILNEKIRSMSIKCKCGRYCYVGLKRNYRICSWCGRKILSKKEEFKTRLMKLLNEV